MATKKPLPVLIAALTFEIGQSDTAVQLLPDGEFRSADGSGRPADCPCWRIDAEIAAVLIAQAKATANRFVIDYEHATLKKAAKGEKAPAAGWYKELEYHPGKGIYAPDVEWTQCATAELADTQYRYISAVFSYDKTGRVTRILHAALTNTPALDGMDEVQVAALSRLAVSFDPPHDQEDSVSLIEKLIAALGLDASATEDQVIAACSAFKTTAADSETKIAALSAQVGAPDPALFVPVTVMQGMQTQIAALTAQVNTNQITDLVDVALSEGRLLPAQEDWARSLGRTDIAALSQFLDTAPKIAVLTTTQTGGKAPAGSGGGNGVDAEQLAVCSQLGLTPEEFAAGKL